MVELEAQLARLLRNLTGQSGETESVYAYGDTIVEMFVCDQKIETQLERDFWLPVFLASQPNARITAVGGRIVVLCGFGKQNDPEGNLLLFRVSTHLQRASRWPDILETRLLAGALLFIESKLRQFGVRMDRNMTNLLQRN
jgi:hypothetical protein